MEKRETFNVPFFVRNTDALTLLEIQVTVI